MQASIITIGDEILIGQIVDTNSVWLSKELNKAGIIVNEIRSIGDDKEQIISAINDLFEISDFIFITGGLGPTKDDITKNVLCELFDCGLVLNDDALQNLKRLLGVRGIEINEQNYSQALVPEKSQVFVNKVGTACGMMLKRGEKLLFSMPGVPFEVKYLTEFQFLPYIKQTYKLGNIFHKTILTSGLPEAVLAEKIADWENSLPKEIKLAFLPTPGYVRLRMSIYNANDDLLALADKKLKELKNIIPKCFKSSEDLDLAVLVGTLLTKYGKTISTAESCTGGKIASMIVENAGSSAYYKGSVVAYDYEAKVNVLNVDKHIMEEFGAVSSQVVEQMAQAVRKLLNTDYAISVSGIAGPDGGTPDKPVGTVWIGLATPEKTLSEKFLFFYDRKINILRTTNTALLMLIDELEGN
ncbi:MAG: CinA family nicotinamide mononucleotide deamidase-related protein [Bacteroidales bacterium]|nr:CinA family nicotinamide mononucleotide deamidase-related protein [Bacteroidales bacterium]MDD4217500.1 CinA family nicotinamide mononucleotide deamidase-related protein [Bacteroidales bacterium]